ncbi:TetR/AcrR family transcriptional regulator [Neobacillus jeddahensis]|uniref:TetR/AcrR family transcriptional regulator n=1 Tax=Neobacillus jeddahensis TaxID=1461580 RepID=UPI00058C1259|nr:TetR/AcrR family transcriptional regulator [Neobacillus jeddahensis]
MVKTTLYHNPSFQHILTITEKIILEKGCRNTTLRDIIEQSGLSKGAIYHYVDSKDELFGLILKSKIEEMNDMFHEMLKMTIKEGNPNQNQFEVVSQFFFGRQNPHEVGNLIFLYLLSQDNEKVKKILHDIFKYSKDTGAHWIKVGQEHCVIPASIDADKMALLMMTFSYGLRVTQIVSTDENDQVEATDIFKVIMKSLM